MYERWMVGSCLLSVMCLTAFIAMLVLRAAEVVAFNVAYCFIPIAVPIVFVPLSSLALDYCCHK